jgi:Cu(I)/Ag(I) efflux system membrane protein CusA/SilA
VRYAPEFRADARALEDVLIATPSGQQLPLSQVVHLGPSRGPAMLSSENGLLLATVLLNVQDRDIGGFVNEAKAAVAAAVTLPPGYFIGWSGRYENQVSARQRLQVVIPIALVMIFVLLYFTYHSALEAAHVLLTVPFALTGGVFLLWLLGYNFSVAVWVGFIALFGTAVQTAVVMVIYLEEALTRKLAERRGRITRADLHDAVVDGALLRLRPKIMTVSTVVAGLLPIMWTDRAGSDVMKPLATPVLGGMVSSLLYVLIVTPVLFYWIHERRLHLEPSADTIRETTPRRWAVGAAVALVAILAVGWFVRGQGAEPAAVEPAGSVLQTVQAGDLTIALSNPGGSLRQGANDVHIVFRSADTNTPVDVGTVRLNGTMTMPGMVMTGTATIAPPRQIGVYDATMELGMSGTWRMTIEWDGPGGRKGTEVFDGSVQ